MKWLQIIRTINALILLYWDLILSKNEPFRHLYINITRHTIVMAVANELGAASRW